MLYNIGNIAIFYNTHEVKWKWLNRLQLFVTPWTIQTMNSPGQNTGVGSHSLLQGISRGSQPRNQTQVSHIADGFFTSWATKDTHNNHKGTI